MISVRSSAPFKVNDPWLGSAGRNARCCRWSRGRRSFLAGADEAERRDAAFLDGDFRDRWHGSRQRHASQIVHEVRYALQPAIARLDAMTMVANDNTMRSSVGRLTAAKG